MAMSSIKKFYKSFFLSNRLFYFGIVIIALFILGNFYRFAFVSAKILLIILTAFFIIDILLLYIRSTDFFKANRIVPQKLSNGDDNEIQIKIKNLYPITLNFTIIDELPFQFQKRDFNIKGIILPAEEKTYNYLLRPVKRGEYSFGNIHVFISTRIGIIQRRETFNAEQTVPVYPSFLQMRRYELLAISDKLSDAGIKKIRRISNNKEFEQIKEYVTGDDYRTVNWKATARKSKLMVNQYSDEKAQHVYSIIDMGRSMKMPFEGMSLLDYAINSALVLSNIAILKGDKAGLITYSEKINSLLPAQGKASQMQNIMEVLYKQKTNFKESNLEVIYSTVKRKIRQRSLLMIYTNFEGLVSLKRQINYFKGLSKNHLVTVIFFENSELKKITNESPQNTEDIYIKTIAEKVYYDKKLIKKELKQHGIYSILTKPEDLTVETINKYLQFKARGLL